MFKDERKLLTTFLVPFPEAFELLVSPELHYKLKLERPGRNVTHGIEFTLQP